MSHSDVFHWCFICRPNRSRWMRRTRPTHWYRWLPFPRNPLTNPPSTESLRQKTGPTQAPWLTATPTMWPLWLTLRCESYFQLLYCDTSTEDPIHASTSVAAEINFTCLYKKKCVFTRSWISRLYSFYARGSHFLMEFSRKPRISWILKSEHDVYIHKHKNRIPKSPIKTGMLKSM